ncbi:MAG: hypothetical protein IJ298_11100 [Ruminococcus sp.]|nr:hypothetical protein [Ruminococcus sp.]
MLINKKTFCSITCIFMSILMLFLSVSLPVEALNKTTTIDGVKIGILEAYGHPEIDGEEFLEGEITKLGSSSGGQEHATKVATIIAGNNIY